MSTQHRKFFGFFCGAVVVFHHRRLFGGASPGGNVVLAGLSSFVCGCEPRFVFSGMLLLRGSPPLATCVWLSGWGFWGFFLHPLPSRSSATVNW